jgi:ABC-2 type transport system permease protein
VNEKPIERLPGSEGGAGAGAKGALEAPPGPVHGRLRAAVPPARFPLRLPRGTTIRAFVRRDYLVTRSYRLAFALDVVNGALLMTTYYFISQTFEGVPAQGLQGAPSYFAFAAVGAAIGAVVETAATGIASRIREEQLAGTLELLAVQPLTSLDLCLGLVGFPFVFGLARAAFYLGLAVAWIGLDPTVPSWPGVVVIFVTTGAALATIGIVSGAFTLLFKRGTTIVGVGLFALTLLSGAVFPISTLPGWLQPIANASPLRFAFDGARSALFQGSGWEWDALWLSIFGAVGIPIAALAFHRSLHHTKRRATLGQY